MTQLCAAMSSATLDELVALKRQLAKLGFAQPVATYVADSGLVVIRHEWLALLRSGRAFTRSFLLTIGVAQQGQTQLFNPSGSGIRVLVYSWAADASIAGAPLVVGTNNVQMGGGAAAPNLLINGPLSVARTASAAAGALPGTTDLIWQELLAVGELAGPGVSPEGFWAELPPGWGLDWDLQQASSVFRVNVLWAEVPPTYPGASSSLGP